MPRAGIPGRAVDPTCSTAKTSPPDSFRRRPNTIRRGSSHGRTRAEIPTAIYLDGRQEADTTASHLAGVHNLRAADLALPNKPA